MKTKKAIITGANGFVGRHLVKELTANDYHCICVVREGSRNISQFKGMDNIEIVYCSLENAVYLPDKINGDCKGSIFFQLAWDGHFGEKRKDYKLQFDSAKHTVDMAISAAKLGCSKFIVSGSVTQLMYQDYIKLNGIHPEMVICYPIARISAESMLKCVCPKVGLDLRWAYISNFYGEDDNTTNFINFIVDSYLREERPTLTSGNQLADFMHVDDVARALYFLAETTEDIDNIYIGYGDPRPLKNFIETVYKLISPGVESGIGLKEFSGNSVDYSSFDYREFARKTGFTPLIPFEQGIARVISVRKENIYKS